MESKNALQHMSPSNGYRDVHSQRMDRRTVGITAFVFPAELTALTRYERALWSRVVTPIFFCAVCVLGFLETV